MTENNSDGARGMGHGRGFNGLAEVTGRVLEYMDEHRTDVSLPAVQDGQRELVSAGSLLRQWWAAAEELSALAAFDALTGLYNRRGFLAAAETKQADAQRYNTEATRNGGKDKTAAAKQKADLTIIMIDLGRFKEVNDTHGHAAGDAVLRHVGQIIASNIRRGDIAARPGGDEFMILINGGSDAANLVARKIGKSLEDQPTSYHNRIIPTTAHLGIAAVNLERPIAESILTADERMYENKLAAQQADMNPVVRLLPNRIRRGLIRLLGGRAPDEPK